jgi:hypothetical protein
MSKTIVITGASSGFGALTARRLADADHTVYAGMRDTTGRNAPQVGAAKRYAAKNDVDLRTIELDVSEPTPLARPLRPSCGAQGCGSSRERFIRSRPGGRERPGQALARAWRRRPSRRARSQRGG